MTFQTLLLLGLLGVLGACNSSTDRVANCQAQGNTRDACTGNEQVLKDDIASSVDKPAAPENPHGVTKLQDAAAP